MKKQSRKNHHASIRRTAHKDGTYDRLLREQGGKCAICGCDPPANRKFDIDHNHSTGKIRSLLCRNDNRRLVYWMTPAKLRAYADYLEKHGN